MKVYKITKGDSGAPLILATLDEWTDILGGIEDDEVGDTYTITVVEMDKAAHESLPEWSGF